MRKKVIILGAGLSGISLGYFLKKRGLNFRIFEKQGKIGGVCTSSKKDGFIFDISGHLLHFKKKETFLLVKSLLSDNLAKLHRSAWIYNFNHLVPYPFQVNLSALPHDVFRYCLSEFIKVRTNGLDFRRADNFLDWIYKNFGAGIAEHFMIPYNLKFWRTPLKELSPAWTDRLVVTPSLKDIIDATNGRMRKNFGYHSSFYYPKRGGIEELIKAFSYGLDDIYLNNEAVEINLKERKVKFKDGHREKFDTLISTIPLPELSSIILGLPKHILSSLKKLRWVSIYNANLGIDSAIQPKQHWIYFPGEDTHFFRVGFFHNFSSHLTPHGRGALYAEVSYSEDRPIDRKTIASKIKDDLKKVGIFKEDTQICCEDINDVKYAYPVYDKNYSRAREKILKFLSRNNVLSCGRYGSWRYFSMEDVILESRERAHLLA